jgi:hypothetical protein
MPYETLDHLLYAWQNKVPVTEVSRVLGLTEDQINRAFRDFHSKFITTAILRMPALNLMNAAQNS